MKCVNCGKEVPKKATACGYCGTPVQTEQVHHCTNCGKEVPPKAKACGYCGAKVKARAAKAKKSAPAKKAPKPAPKKPASVKPAPVAKKVKPAVEKAAPKVRAPLVEPKKLPLWAVPAGLGAAALILVVVLVLGRSPSQPDAEEPLAEPAQPAGDEPVPAAPLADESVPLIVYPYCSDQMTIPANRDIRFRYTWLTAEGEQAQEFIDLAEFDFRLDGDPISLTPEKLFFRKFRGDDVNFANYYSEVLQLSPGTHHSEGEVQLAEAHFDGWDWYGPDTGSEMSDYACEFFADPDLGEDYDELMVQLSNAMGFYNFRLVSNLDERPDVDQFDVNFTSFDEGYAEIAPDGYVHYNFSYSPYENGTLALFKFEPADTLDFFVGYEIYSDPYQHWGIIDTGDLYFFREPEESQRFPLDGDLEWEPGRWYYLFLAFDQSDQVYARVWEKGSPENAAELYTDFDAPVEDEPEWYFSVANWGSATGDVYVDKIILVNLE